MRVGRSFLDDVSERLHGDPVCGVVSKPRSWADTYRPADPDPECRFFGAADHAFGYRHGPAGHVHGGANLFQDRRRRRQELVWVYRAGHLDPAGGRRTGAELRRAVERADGGDGSREHAQVRTANLVAECYDNSTPPQSVEPDSVLVDGSSYDVTINFSTPQTGYCVLNGAGGSGGLAASGMAAPWSDLSVALTNPTMLSIGSSCSASAPCNVRFGS